MLKDIPVAASSGPGRARAGRWTFRCPAYAFEELCALDASARAGGITAIEKDLAAILYTSGSTGKPKGVMLSHAQVMAGSSIVSTYLEITEADRILAVLPFSFDAGMNQLMTAWQQGGDADPDQLRVRPRGGRDADRRSG